ncbi:MAG: hypothetical protein ACOH1Q_07110 [Thiobacillus sp.]
MKDSIQLIVVALLFAAVAWGFWYYLGENGFGVITLVALIALFTDNVRLRRKLRSARPVIDNTP